MRSGFTGSPERGPGEERGADDQTRDDEHDIGSARTAPGVKWVHSHPASIVRPMQAMQVGRRWWAAAALVIGATVLGLAGCAGTDAPEVPTAADGTPDVVLAEGRDVWLAQCARCHGGDGSGGAGPGIRGPWGEDRSPDATEMARIVVEGRGAMPGFGSSLDDSEVEAVVRYVREVL